MLLHAMGSCRSKVKMGRMSGAEAVNLSRIYLQCLSDRREKRATCDQRAQSKEESAGLGIRNDVKSLEVKIKKKVRKEKEGGTEALYRC